MDISKLLAVLLITATAELAAQPPDRVAPATEPSPIPPPISTTAGQAMVIAQPCLGAGYVPYSYPGVDTCPCVRDGCFPPARYYCGGETYRNHWWSKWLRAHFAGGSMLDGYPCHCIFPTVGRPVLQTTPDLPVTVDPLAPQSTEPDGRR